MKRFGWVLVLVGFVVSAADAKELAIIGAGIYPSPEAQPISDGTVLMRNGKIVAVGASEQIEVGGSTEVIDGRGLVVAAGFWNSHVHLILPAMSLPPSENAEALSNELESMLTRWGFTTVVDVASLPGAAISLRDRIAAGEVRGPNILTVDAPFFPNDGVPFYVRDLVAGLPTLEVETPEKAAMRARKQLQAGADGVKIFTGSSVGGEVGVLPMPLDAARAVVAEAHRAGKPAFAHPGNLEGVEIAIKSGVDILAHTTPDDGKQWTPGLVQSLKSRQMALIPTLALWGVELKKQGLSDARIESFVGLAQQQLRAYATAGGEILFGTDVGYIDAADTTDEYLLMAGAGLSYQEILTSLTTAPAARFDFEQKGKVLAGMDADLTILAADPAQDVSAFAQVVFTIRGGKVIFRAEIRE